MSTWERALFIASGTVLAVCGYFGPADDGTLEFFGFVLIAYGAWSRR